jgi:hypothetical protein
VSCIAAKYVKIYLVIIYFLHWNMLLATVWISIHNCFTHQISAVWVLSFYKVKNAFNGKRFNDMIMMQSGGTVLPSLKPCTYRKYSKNDSLAGFGVHKVQSRIHSRSILDQNNSFIAMRNKFRTQNIWPSTYFSNYVCCSDEYLSTILHSKFESFGILRWYKYRIKNN